MNGTELTAFERVKNARHPDRPYTLDLFENIFTDFVEIHGDRRYADELAERIRLMLEEAPVLASTGRPLSPGGSPRTNRCRGIYPP